MTDAVSRHAHAQGGRYHDSGAIAVFDEAGIACIATIHSGCLPAIGRDDAAQANARLIAAAPDLLAACKAMVDACGSRPTLSVDAADKLARAAIAKATGAPA